MANALYDPYTAALNSITLGGVTGGYGGAITPGSLGDSIAGYTNAATATQVAPVAGEATPSVYTPGLPVPTTTTTDPLKTGDITGGWNMKDLFTKDGMGLVLGGLQTIGGLWGAWKANQLAEKQFKFASDFANKNLANQTASYNTALEDRGRARAFTEGQSAEVAQAYIDENRLRA